MTFLRSALLVWALSVLPVIAGASNYGCTSLGNHHEVPTLEGKNGVFFRVQSDLRMDHRFSTRAISQLAELSRALKMRGTELVYVPVPTKALAMPQALPEEARLYGYEAETAKRVYLDLLRRFEQAGITTVDLATPMASLPLDEPAFFGADFHWTAYGAQVSAQAIAQRLQSTERFDSLPKRNFRTEPAGFDTAFSGLRRLLQDYCTDTLPRPVSPTFATKELLENTESLDLFGAEEPSIVLVGTSFSDSEINNFPGFLQQYTQLEVLNYALTGGNQFGAIKSYLTFQEFQENPPAYLIWENPIYNSLSRFGDQPMRELIEAAKNDCELSVEFDTAAGGTVYRAALPQGWTEDSTVFLDTQAATSEVSFTFTDREGTAYERRLKRGDRLRKTGRFYLALNGLGEPREMNVTVQFSAPPQVKPSLFICSFNQRTMN